MRKFIRSIWFRASFSPGLLGLFVNPFYFARKDLAKHIAELGGCITGRTLDIGCGCKHYEQLCASNEYIGIEIDTEENRKSKKADYFYDGIKLPFEDGSFDSVLTSQVFEHVFNPDGFLHESCRVLKPGGLMLITAPFVWDEHEQPYDYARYSSFGMRALLESHGYEIVEFRKSVEDIRVVFQLLNCYIQKKTATRSRLVNLFFVLILIAPWNILGELLYRIMPRNSDLYLNNIVLAKKMI
jgi:SAM-dependent methyltransferase